MPAAKLFERLDCVFLGNGHVELAGRKFDIFFHSFH
jgi:hypothetical protein